MSYLSVLENDIAVIRQMEKDNALFTYETHTESLRHPSTGILATLSVDEEEGGEKHHQRVFCSSRMELY